jgi:hypothetical protein
MKKLVIGAAIAFGAEVLTSWWRWVRAPTDTLRVQYESFFAYEAERLVPWMIMVVVLNVSWLLVIKYWRR